MFSIESLAYNSGIKTSLQLAMLAKKESLFRWDLRKEGHHGVEIQRGMV